MVIDIGNDHPVLWMLLSRSSPEGMRKAFLRVRSGLV